LFDTVAFVRVVLFGIVYGGIEYRYVNRYERKWTKTQEEFLEKPVFWVISPYHLYLLLPLFLLVSFTVPITAWAGNVFFLVVFEDMAYFAWRGSKVTKADWTTTLFGSFRVGGAEVPLWWPLDLALAALLFWAPV